MSYESNLEDTRPQPALRDEDMVPGQVYEGDDGSGSRGMSCGVTALMIVFLGLIAIGIVALTTYAGWTVGQREAATLAAATQASRIDEQLAFIPRDIESRNTFMLNVRLQWLSLMTPGVPQVSEIGPTATAIFMEEQLSATPLATATATPTPEIAATSTEAPIATNPGGGFDLADLLGRAQTAVDTAQWNEAIDLLDAISGLDPTYEATRVRRLLMQALNRYAAELYNTYRPGDPGRLAEAIVITDRAEQLGPLDNGLAYERNAAQLYLDVRRMVGLDPWQAIQALEQLSGLGQGRYYEEARQQLQAQWVALGDAQVSINEYCPAVQYYQNAINVSAAGGAIAKRDNASNLCAQATPVPLPGTVLPPADGIAPIGVVATPIG
ncbi:MAG: hypothetical protein KC547_12075 [Anaerolineae bacterium]|nr:hypothetical protein [Anaerolineae bacterium]